MRIVDRHNVDMENEETIERWIEKVLSSLGDVDMMESQDYLPQSLNTQQTDVFTRSNPFYATIKVVQLLCSKQVCIIAIASCSQGVVQPRRGAAKASCS